MTVAVEMGIKADGVTEWKLELTKLGVRYSMPFTDIGRRCRSVEMSSVVELDRSVVHPNGDSSRGLHIWVLISEVMSSSIIVEARKLNKSIQRYGREKRAHDRPLRNSNTY